MLLQSHSGFVQFLPAIPSSWKDGQVTGLRARGGFVITDIKLNNAKITYLKVKSTIGGNLRLRSYSALKMANGDELTNATGENGNVMMQA